MKARRIGMIFGLMLLSFALSRADEPAPRPNIVCYFADVMGWGTIRANQTLAAANGVDTTEIKKLITPNIDALAERGTNFSHAYGKPVCSPSRSCQQTGFQLWHTWADRNGRSHDQSTSGTLELELGKHLPLTVKGAVTLNGTLKCSSSDGAAIPMGKRTTILAGASVTGTFKNPGGLV
ncbi:Sulfatase [Planctomycetes bacterium CA13]|uniref:Sulfatase n=1 Tax=Novipirellula herctigrandis TaxID=2527986 RepID=A0A5C5ZA37_9BACT|nr:Sulfatase [Planctomycetes bacterium CA13]